MVNILESVFANIPEITTSCTQEEIQKPKRSAFVFMTSEPEDSAYALEDLKKIDAVKEVYLAKGAYDIVAKISGESFEAVKEIVHTKIRNLDSIKSTLTLTVI